MISKRFILITFPILLLLGVYFLGPEPATPKFAPTMPLVPNEPDKLESYINANEARHNVKPDNEARIIWFDSARSKTEYSVIYLHGFSASQEEGDPIHTDFAKRYGCNLYLARLADHGIDTTEQLLYFTPDRLWESAKEALAIGKAIGDKVIVMSTSTGGTVALMLAAQYPDDVYALINMSPNIAINNPTAFLLNDPWGLQIARMVIGSDYQVIDYPPARQQYWNGKYRLESLTQLEELLEVKMNKETFQQVTEPSLTLYYYQDEEHQDPTVKVSAMLTMNEQLGTDPSKKRAIAIPGAGAHVIGSHLVSKDLEAVTNAANQFAEEVLGLTPVDN
ncbi:MAG: alpha/beta hydrolase [Cyclobacteriaceae bacterium]|nr:alpha/beta hydrolase [Cyclobacteriaceae bacterium]